MSTTFAALRERNYRWFLGGQAVTNIGTWMQRIAQDWLVLEISGGNAIALGITTSLQFLPFVLFAPYAGVLADRYSKRLLLAITGVVGAAAAGCLGLLVVAGQADLGAIYVLAFVLGAAAAMDNPTRQALLGQIVPRTTLPNAVALNSTIFNVSRLVGPALAGLLIAWVGTAVVFGVNALSFLVAVATLLMLRPNSESRPSGVAVTMRAGAAYVRSRTDLIFVLIAVGIMATFAFNFAITTALMATAEFKVGAAAYGLMNTALAIGSVTGALLATRRTSPNLVVVFGAGVAMGIAEVIAGLMPSYGWFLAMLPVCGVLAMTFSVTAMSYLQTMSAPEQRGRVMGWYALVFFGGNPIGAPVLGVLATTFGPRWCLLGGGLAAAISLSAVAFVACRRGVFATGSTRLPEVAESAAHRPSLVKSR